MRNGAGFQENIVFSNARTRCRLWYLRVSRADSPAPLSDGQRSGSSRERNLVGRIRNGLLLVISAVREGYVPDFARATAPLTSLEISLGRRAVAVDRDC